jgi:NTE family protein
MSSFDHPAGCEPRRIVFLFLLVLLGPLASAQSPLAVEHQGQQLPASVPAQRPRIGLALSGGGALGLAQIGVIQWLEENHIPVDRMAGTSMGSIIGVMYATGMSPAEMQKLAEGIDWNEALLPEPKYRQLSYRRKQDRRDYQVEAALGIKHGLRGPNGFDPGLSVGLLLDRIAFSDSGIASFDELPIPFRCVATDMQSGDRVVLHDGSLPRAVRASMAIPGVFTPVEIDGRVLADGGMVENIPVEAVREMDADSVIAVDLQLPAGGREQLETLTGVLSRAVSVMILQNERRSLALASTTITVDTGDFSIGDYSRVPELIRLGYQSAAGHAAALLAYAIRDDAEWQEYLTARNARKSPQPKEVQSLVVEGGDSDTNHRIEQHLNSDTGVPLNLPKL